MLYLRIIRYTVVFLNTDALNDIIAKLGSLTNVNRCWNTLDCCARAYQRAGASESIVSYRSADGIIIIIVIMVVKKEPEKKKCSVILTTEVVVCVDTCIDLVMSCRHIYIGQSVP